MNTAEANKIIAAECPDWFDSRYCDVDSIRAIIQGGCDSGAYIPAVTYHQARETMAVHGDDVLDYIYDICGQLPELDMESGWSGLNVVYLSCAVELWSMQFEELIEEMDNDG
jgi:hypothetical protein